MKVNRNSRKRNHRSPPLSSTITRSQSLHRNRSGHVPFEPVRRNIEPNSVPVPVDENGATKGISDSEYNILIQDICKIYSESEPEDKIIGNDICKKLKHDDGDLPCAATKDLRVRRVYSTVSNGASSGIVGSALSNGSDVVSDMERAELGFGTPSSKEDPDLGLSCEPRNFEGGNTESSHERMNLQINGRNGGDCSEKNDDFGEETVLTTPPDALICVNVEVNGNASKMEEKLGVEDKSLAGNGEENSGEEFSGIKDGQSKSLVLKSKTALKPRLPGKLFKAPGSVNFRRLIHSMGEYFSIPKWGHFHKDKKAMDRQGFELPLSSDNHEPFKPKTIADSCIMCDSPMQLETEKVNVQCLSVPSVNDKCSSESNADLAADFLVARDVGNALEHGDFKQDSINGNNLDCAKATDQNECASDQLGVLNEDFVPTTHDADICRNLMLNADQMQGIPQNACQVKPMDLTRCTQERAVELLCTKADKRNEPLKSKYLHRPNLQGKLIKTPGSVNYRRLLPYLKNLAQDDSGTSKFGDQTHHKRDEVNLRGKEFQLSLPSQSEEASFNRQMIPGSPKQGKVESNALENNILVNPANGFSHGYQPKLTSSQDLSELPMQLDANEVVHDCLSAPSVQDHSEKVVIDSIDECLSESKSDPCSVMVDSHCANIVANDVHHDGFNQVQTMISRQHCSESPLKDQNLLNSYGKGFTTVYDERRQFGNLKSHESEGQHLSQLDPNILVKEENEQSSPAFSENDGVVALSYVNISNEEPISSSENIIADKPDLPVHGVDKAGSLLNGLVYGSKKHSKGSSDKNTSCAGEIENGSESNTTMVLNRCPRTKSLKTVESNSCASNDDHPRKRLKLSPLLPISESNLEVTSLSDSNDCVPMDASTGNYGAQQKTELQACDLNNDSSSPRPELQYKQIVVNGHYKLENFIGSPIRDEVITRIEEATPALCNEEKPLQTIVRCQSLTQLKVIEQLRAPAVGFRKGILRKNPRGCRGLCTCLNCASFRLHAERAFEFSKIQLLDAEEVARDLMKEVSYLRNMLERYTDNVDDTPLFDGSQVKEACRKAFETEQLAKDRLSQMNDDLNIHCRTPILQRPSVKFSDHLEEKVIPSGK